MDNPRRKFLATGAALGAAASLPNQAQAADANLLFAVEPTFIPMVGSASKFQVRRIYCVGRNYAAHAREMGSDPTRGRPSFSRNRPMRSSWCRPASPSTIPIRR